MWSTLAGGTLSEVYYPSADTPNSRLLEFVVTDTADDAGRWRLTKTHVTEDALTAMDARGPAASALVSSTGFDATFTGYIGTSDGVADLARNLTLTSTYPKAGPGNVAQVARIKPRTTLALGFAATEQATPSAATPPRSTPEPTRASTPSPEQRGADHYGIPALHGTITSWFRLHLMGDEQARGLYFGPDCASCASTFWSIFERNAKAQAVAGP